ncbi:chloramphenicol resistance protein [Brucella endophytica]|uniref:Chloramphenicol resistance protein n=1 Tax=Brucella endophytica TaxID=1963359 RepID=A0A916SPY2_9HYPH|nr:MFS transporter [Brucella endophytica]GGB12264.1 chloramphenicol resistance protein [Brucella endophytica]
MHPALFALAISAFAIGTTEFLTVGIMPNVAHDLGITLPMAGLIVSVYALGATIGAPVLTALTGHIARRPLLLGLMTLFTLGNMVAAISPNYEILLIARIMTAFAHGVFFAIGATIAASMVPENRRASAIAIVFSGLTIAIATGVPLGTMLGQALGWRASFWAVTGLGLVSLLAMFALLPRSIKVQTPGTLADQARVLGSGRLLMAFGMNLFGYGGTFVAFTYLASILENITGVAPNQIGIMMFLYGASVIAGNIIGGRVADRDPVPVLIIMFALQAVALAAFTLTAGSLIGTVLTLALLGGLSFCNVPGLHLYVVQLAQKHRPGGVDVASALNIAAANLGIALSAAVGGMVVDSRLGLGATPWVGALLVTVALGLTVWSGLLDRRERAMAANAGPELQGGGHGY